MQPKRKDKRKENQMRITKELIEIDDMDLKDRTPEQQRALTAYYQEARMFQEERQRQKRKDTET